MRDPLNKTEQIAFRVTAEQRTLIRQAAKAAVKREADFVRNAALKAAREQISALVEG